MKFKIACFFVFETRDVHYALRVITGNVDGPCVMCIFRGNVPYFYGASLVLQYLL